MKYIKLFEEYDPYELMMIPSYKKAEMIIVESGKDNPNLDLVKDLITLGANLDWQDESDGNNPLLSYIVGFKNTKILKILLESGANPNLQNDSGRSALHYTSATNLFRASKILLEYNANPNILNTMKKTPLHFAAYFNNLMVVQLLLESGADPNLKDINGKKPLDLVAKAPWNSIYLNKTYRPEGTIEILKEYMK